MCVACHARKTQEEALSRTEMERAERKRIRERFENDVRREEEKRRIEDREKDGTATCRDCGARYYPLFPHACVEVKRRCSRRLIGCSADRVGGGLKRPKKTAGSSLFEEYFFTGSV